MSRRDPVRVAALDRGACAASKAGGASAAPSSLSDWISSRSATCTPRETNEPSGTGSDKSEPDGENGNVKHRT